MLQKFQLLFLEIFVLSTSNHPIPRVTFSNIEGFTFTLRSSEITCFTRKDGNLNSVLCFNSRNLDSNLLKSVPDLPGSNSVPYL